MYIPVLVFPIYMQTCNNEEFAALIRPFLSLFKIRVLYMYLGHLFCYNITLAVFLGFFFSIKLLLSI